MNHRSTNRRLWTALIAMSSLCSAVYAAGETITVTTLNDIVDFGGQQKVLNLPGPDGKVSFREAVTAANNTAGPQTIHFAIPQSEWWLYNDRAILRLEDGAFSVNDDETTIDFTTQTDFTGDTNPNGWEVGIYGLQPNAWGVSANFVNGDNCVIKGLDRVMQRGYGVSLGGHFNKVISCTISGPLYAGVIIEGFPGQPATNNVVGGTLPGEGNVLSGGNAGVRIDGPAEDNVVIGNTLVGSPFAGVEVRGAYCCPDYTPYDNRIGGPTPQERNWIADNGQFGEEGFPLGDQVRVEYAVGTIVEGNYIGTTEDGSAAFPNGYGTVGVAVRESVDTTVRDNVIAAMLMEGANHYIGDFFGTGVSVYSAAESTVIQGNLVGTDATGQNPLPNLVGISVAPFPFGDFPVDTVIGGTSPGQANVVAHSVLQGVRVSNPAVGATISGNSIFENGELGIDLLGGTGVTPNDPGDGDTGGNNLQNFPVLSEATSDGTTTTLVSGTLNSSANATYVIEFFANDSCDPSGHGEGQFFLGAMEVATGGGGNAMFDASLSEPAGEGQLITATATRVSTGDTSEFSACIAAIVETVVPGDIDGDGDADLDDFAILLDCMDGPGFGVSPECVDADLTGDGDVDIEDFGGFGNLLMVE